MRRADAFAAALLLLVTLFGTAAGLGTATEAEASEDSIFAPYMGFVGGGDTRKHGATFGFSTAYLAENDWGGEFDVSYVTDFNDVDFESTSIATVMINLMTAPKLSGTLSRWMRPYAVAGLGLIRARGCDRPNCVTTLSRTSLGLDAGGGVLVPINDIYGIRGDVRYFRYAFNHADLPRTGNGQFDFWRFSVGATITW